MGLFDRLTMFHPAGEGMFGDSSAFSRIDHSVRIKKQYRYWNFFNGKHWEYEKEENVPQVTINYCRAFVSKTVSFLFHKGFKFTFDSEAEEKAVLPTLKKIWDDDNNREAVCLQMGQIGSVTGDVYVLVTVEDADEDGNRLPPEERKIKLLPINSVSVIPTWSADSMRSLIKVTIFYGKYSVAKNKDVVYRIEITKKEIREYEDDEEIESRRRANILREIPVVHIPNYIDAGSPYGVSDLEDIAPLNKEYNEKATDVSDVLDYLGQPVVVVKGANANKIKGVGRIWAGLPLNSEVSILNLNAPMEASVDYLNLLKKGMHETAGIPETSMGSEQHVSNTAGVAMHMQYMPLMEKIWQKRITYGEGIKKITEIALKLMEKRRLIKPGVASAMKSKYQVQIAWNDPLPKDLLNQVNIVAKKMELGIASRKSAMRELAIEDVEKILGEIKDDAKEELELIYDEGGNPSFLPARATGGVGPSGFEEGTGVHKGDNA